MLDIEHDMTWDGDQVGQPLPGAMLVDRGHGDVAVVSLIGEHDLRTRDALRETLQDLVAGGMRLVLDLSAADYIDSCVLNAAVDADTLLRERGARLVLLLGSAPIVDRVLMVSGLAAALPCADAECRAVALARGR